MATRHNWSPHRSGTGCSMALLTALRQAWSALLVLRCVEVLLDPSTYCHAFSLIRSNERATGGMHTQLSGWRKRGVEFKGGSLHDGFGNFGAHLALLCLPYKIQCQEATVTVLTVLAVLAVVAVLVMTATPLKLNPPFPSSWNSVSDNKSQRNDRLGGYFWPISLDISNTTMFRCLISSVPCPVTIEVCKSCVFGCCGKSYLSIYLPLAQICLLIAYSFFQMHSQHVFASQQMIYRAHTILA